MSGGVDIDENVVVLKVTMKVIIIFVGGETIFMGTKMPSLRRRKNPDP